MDNSNSFTISQNTSVADDWKDEYLLRLKKSFIYSTLESKCDKTDIEVISLVHKAVSYTIQRTKTIIKHMGEFTLHDGDHLFRVLNLMERLLSKETIEQLSIPGLIFQPKPTQLTSYRVLPFSVLNTTIILLKFIL